MSAEQPTRLATGMHTPSVMLHEAARLDGVATQLMTVQKNWADPGRPAQLSAALTDSRTVWGGIQTALAEGTLALPVEVQHNLLVLSVYADCKISACEVRAPSEDMLGSLIALTRTLAGSLKEWRVAA